MTLIKKLESIFHMMEDITDDEIDSLDANFVEEFNRFATKIKLEKYKKNHIGADDNEVVIYL